MNCDAVKEMLSRGQPLTELARHHIASCAGCRAMLEALTMPPPDLAATQIYRIQSLITASVKTVQPLPSDIKLTSILMTMFVMFSLTAATPVGYHGFHVLDPYQRFAYYGVILLCGTWFSITAVQEMIPGSKHRTSSVATIFGSTLSLALLVCVLFHDFDLTRFIALGMPCLRLGVVCAALSAALFWLLLRKGFITSPFAAGAIIGSFAGLAGVAVLALHCPIENSAHILVWHFGAVMLAGIAGAVIADLGRLKPRRDTGLNA
jgi:hypothetical protein